MIVVVVALLFSASASYADARSVTPAQWVFQWGPTGAQYPTAAFPYVSCGGPSFCIAAGSFGYNEAVLLSWNGSSWSTALTLTASNTFSPQFNGVSCASTTYCLAYGNASYVWNGTHWNATAPNTVAVVGAQCSTVPGCTAGMSCTAFFGPSCLYQTIEDASCSGNSCIAFGSTVETAGCSGDCTALWYSILFGSSWSNGHNLSLPRSTGFGTRNPPEMLSASCAGINWCMLLVSDSSTSSGVENDILTWTPGRTMKTTLLQTPGTSTSGDDITSVSCVTTTYCLALGTYAVILGGFQRILAEVWDGSSWRIVPSPSLDPHGDLWLNVVTCTAVNYCTAAGGTSSNSRNYALGQFFGAVLNGSQWNISQPSVNPGSVPLLPVDWKLACPTSSCVVFIGATPVVWKPGGTIEIQSSPFTAPRTGHFARGISCTSGAFCMLVGDMTDPTGHTEATTNTLYGNPSVGQGDGAGWNSYSGVGFPGSMSWTLSGVSCIDSADCVAVGHTDQSGKQVVLAEQWNGTKWQSISSGIAGVSGLLSSVSCTTLAFCATVGDEGNSATGMVAIWDGASWTVHAAPDTSRLMSISCVVSGTCLAVGSFRNTPVLIQWNGSALQSIPIASNQSFSGSFDGVFCLSGLTCMAVGNRETGAGSMPVADIWTGTTLEAAEIGLPDSGGAVTLRSVTCTATNVCYAAGNTQATQDSRNVLIAWNGSSWITEKVANQSPTTEDALDSVTCGNARQCLAAGTYIKDGVSYTFIVRLVPAHAVALAMNQHAGKPLHRKTSYSPVESGAVVILALVLVFACMLVLFRRSRRDRTEG